MYTKLKSLKAYSNETLNLQELVALIRDNPNKPIIERMRKEGKSSDSYRKLKSTLPAIMPHGVFGSLKEADLIELSGFLFFDIDNLKDEREARDTIDRLRDAFSISMACLSPGGKGIHFLIRIDCAIPNDIARDTNAIWKASFSKMKSMLKEAGFDIDEAAGGLARKMAISSDPDAFMDEMAIQTIQVSKDDLDSLTPSQRTTHQDLRDCVIPSIGETIPWEELLDRLVLATPAPKMDDCYLVEEQEYCEVRIYKIKDGMKRKTFPLMMHNLMHLNPGLTLDEAISFFIHVNNIQEAKMDILKLILLIKWVYKCIMTNGAKPSLRIKKIHFMKEAMTTKEKQSISGKLTSLVRRNETVTKIYLAIQEGYVKQKDVVAYTGLSIATVKRNWKAAQNCDIETAQDVIERPTKRVRKPKEENIRKEGESLSEAAIIEEEDFWEGFSIAPKEIEEPEEDWGESDGIEGFIETIE